MYCDCPGGLQRDTSLSRSSLKAHAAYAGQDDDALAGFGPPPSGALSTILSEGDELSGETRSASPSLGSRFGRSGRSRTTSGSLASGSCSDKSLAASSVASADSLVSSEI